MKRSIYIMLLTAVSLLIPYKGLGQIIPSVQRDLTVYSPQVTDVIRYDHVPISLNTGCADVTVPLVGIKDQDFDLSLSLSYNSSGFRPQESDNYVGRNWSLNGLGVVYRKVNGVPDDIASYCLTEREDYADGFLGMLGNTKFTSANVTEQNIKSNPYNYARRKNDVTAISTVPGMTGNMECSADIFYFSVGKHAGKFMINYDGSVSVMGYEGGRYAVDLSGMVRFNSTKPQNTYIRIKTDDGYVYTFGGQGYASLEYNALSWKTWTDIKSNVYARNEITAYYLTEIKAPNGRKLSITYKDLASGYHEDPTVLTQPSKLETYKQAGIPLFYSLSGRHSFVADNVAPTAANLTNQPRQGSNKYCLTKVALVDKIATENEYISFTYSSRSVLPAFDGLSKTIFPMFCGAKLDKVERLQSGSSQTATLNYSYQNGNRMFLSSVKHSLHGKYQFEYKGFGSITPPSPLTANIDHWGFWRGKKSNSGIMPGMKPEDDSNLSFVCTTDDREPTGEDYDCTLLNRVIYPTGGKAEFAYEPHQYSTLFVQKYTTHFFPGKGYPQTGQYGIAGGARIRSVRYTDKSGNAQKAAVYTYGYATHMGELMYMPFYKYTYTIKGSAAGKYAIDQLAFSSDGITSIPYPAQHIRYPQVTVHYVEPSNMSLTGKHPYKTIDFVGYLSSVPAYGDESVFATYEASRPTYLSPGNYFINLAQQEYNKNLLAHPTLDISQIYNKIAKESYYSNDSKLIKSIEYDYDYLDRKKHCLYMYTPSSPFHLRTELYTHIGKELFSPYVMKKKIETAYDIGNVNNKKVERQWFAYNDKGDLTRYAMMKNGGDSLVNSYSYIYQSTNSCIQTLLQKDSRIQGSSQNLGDVQYAYSLLSGNGTSWYVPASVAEGMPGKMETRATYAHYDIYGNATECKLDGVTPTIYLWGYNGRYLVARIENASYDAVKVALGKTPESISANSAVDTSVSLLRGKLPDARIMTYRYLPYAGITEEVDAAGRTMVYEYDGKGRLSQSFRLNASKGRGLTGVYKYHLVNE